METALVGVLEFRNDRFINNVLSRLNDVPVEFISLAAEKTPVEKRYRVLVDRLSFCYPFLREVVKSLSLSGTYVINNPFSASTTNKILDIKLGNRLGLAFPKTIVLPDQKVITETDGSAKQPDLVHMAEELGFPCVLKPYDGYGWEDVYVVKSADELQNMYLSLSSRHILLAQQLIRFKAYFRAFCFDKQDVLFIKWIPRPFSMGQYLHCEPEIPGTDKENLSSLTVRLNEALDLDINVVEWCMDEEGHWWVIDAFNEVPEIIPEALPSEYYSWVVDRFVACIRDKLNSGKRNRSPFPVLPFCEPQQNEK
jgi:hypothetical protein